MLAAIDSSMIDWARDFALSQPLWVICFVALISVAMEYLVPPFPGDVLVVCSIIVALAGAANTIPSADTIPSPSTTQVHVVGYFWRNALLFLCLQLGALIGIYANMKLLDRLVSRRVQASKKFQAVKSTFQSGGTALLLAHRFLPGMRALIIGAAVLSGLKQSKILILGFVSAGLWHLFLYAIAVTVHSNIERMLHLLRSFGLLVGIVLVCVLGSFAAFLWISKRRSR